MGNKLNEWNSILRLFLIPNDMNRLNQLEFNWISCSDNESRHKFINRDNYFVVLKYETEEYK